MIGTLALAICSLIFCTTFCVVRTKKMGVWSLMLKGISSICFVLCGLFATSSVGSFSVNLLIVAGLVLGLVGDVLLDLKVMYPQQSNQYFVAGTACFAVGHIFYFASAALFCNQSLHLGWNILASVGVAVLLTLVILFASKKMGMNFGKMLPIVLTYSFILTFMMAFSVAIAIFSPMFWIFAAGMICFFLSDLVLSMQYFGARQEKVWVFVNHFLYYIAQCLLAISILYLLA